MHHGIVNGGKVGKYGFKSVFHFQKNINTDVIEYLVLLLSDVIK